MHDLRPRPRWLDLRERAELGRPRAANSARYRLAHWPIWIWVFFLAPGPMTFALFERGLDARMAAWLAIVVAATGMAGLAGRLPGVERAPYILRFTEDRPNPLYRRVCYTFAWSAILVYAILNIAGLVWALATGTWQLAQIYDAAYFPLAATVWTIGALGWLPRVGRSTANEGHERRFFYGALWAVCVAQPALWLMWPLLPETRAGDSVKLAVFLAILIVMGALAKQGRLIRTRPVTPGELAVSD